MPMSHKIVIEIEMQQVELPILISELDMSTKPNVARDLIKLDNAVVTCSNTSKRSTDNRKNNNK
jgi:GH35 family endo-1,4-beta-xylanase